MNNQLIVTLIKSPIGAIKSHRDCVRGLGLRRLNQTVQVINSPENFGMVKKITHLVQYQVQG